MINLIQYLRSLLSNKHTHILLPYSLVSCLCIPAFGAVDLVPKPFIIKQKVNIPTKKLHGTMKYTIDPTFFTEKEPSKKPAAPIIIQRTYKSPKKRTDYIMVSPPRIPEVDKYAALVKASKTYINQYDDFFYTQNKKGNKAQIKQMWKHRSAKKNKEKMVIYYRQKTDQNWVPIGEVGFNGISHGSDEKEIFFWRGEAQYLTPLVGEADHLKGIMSTASIGFMHYSFHQDAQLKRISGYAKPANKGSKNLLSSIGFTDTKTQDHTAEYDIYTFSQNDFKEAYPIFEDTNSSIIPGLCFLMIVSSFLYLVTRKNKKTFKKNSH